MSRTLWVWDGKALKCADNGALEQSSKWKVGQYVTTEVKTLRNHHQFALYWAMVAMIHENQSYYATKQDVSDALKIGLGHCSEVRLKNGTIAAKPKSIAFGNMSQEEWNEFFNAAVQLVCEKIIPSLKPSDLKRELERMTTQTQR